MILTSRTIDSAPKQHLPALYVLFIIAQIAFVWSLPWLPTQDGPSHVYNLAILKDLRSGGTIWGKWFEQNLTLAPNLGFTLFTYPFLSFASPFVAERMFTSIYILIFSTAIPLSLRLLNLTIFPWSFFVFPAIWSYAFAMGFYSYVIALPLLTIAIALTVRTRNAVILARCILTTTISSFLFVCHLIPFCCFGLFVMISIFFDDTYNLRKRFLIAGILLAPSAAALAWHLSLSASSYPLSAPDFLTRLPWLITDIATASTIFFSPLQIVSGLALSMLLYALARDSIARDSSDYIQKVFGIFALSLFILTFISPPSLGGGGFFNQRLPTVMLIALVPYFSSYAEGFSHLLRKAVVPVIAIVIVVNAVTFLKMSSLVDKFMAARNASMRAGSVLMPYRHLGQSGSRVDVLAHAVSHYALIHSLINAGNYEMQFSYFPVQYKAGMRELLPSPDQVNNENELVDFERFRLIEYLIVWNKSVASNAEEKFSKVIQYKQLEVWEKL